MARTWSAREQREEEKIALSKQQQQKKEGVARRQRGTRGMRESFGGAVANLALVTPGKISGRYSMSLNGSFQSLLVLLCP